MIAARPWPGPRDKAFTVGLVLLAHLALLLAWKQPRIGSTDRDPPRIGVRLLPLPIPEVVERRPVPMRARGPSRAESASPPVTSPEAPAGPVVPEGGTPDAALVAPGPSSAPRDPRRAISSVQPSLAERARAQLPATQAEPALSRGIAKAARPDCKDAYAGAGLLALPMLAIDAVRDDGCKWR